MPRQRASHNRFPQRCGVRCHWNTPPLLIASGWVRTDPRLRNIQSTDSRNIHPDLPPFPARMTLAIADWETEQNQRKIWSRCPISGRTPAPSLNSRFEGLTVPECRSPGCTATSYPLRIPARDCLFCLDVHFSQRHLFYDLREIDSRSRSNSRGISSRISSARMRSKVVRFPLPPSGPTRDCDEFAIYAISQFNGLNRLA